MNRTTTAIVQKAIDCPEIAQAMAEPITPF